MTGTGDRSTTLNRFDEEPDQEKSDEEEKRRAARRQTEILAKKRFQKIGLSVLQSFHLPSREEQLDFFARPWDKYDDEFEEMETKRKEREEQEKAKKSKKSATTDDVDEIVAEDDKTTTAKKEEKKDEEDKANGKYQAKLTQTIQIFNLKISN